MTVLLLAAMLAAEDPTAAVPVTGRYLLLPSQAGTGQRRLTVTRPGEGGKTVVVADLDAEWPRDRPDGWVPVDLGPQAAGGTVTLRLHSADRAGPPLTGVQFADAPPDAAPDHPLRPRWHFTAPRGWLNDPNGLVYAGGVFHLFYQHNPYGWAWGNMHWGHATSRDLFSWRHRPIALTPPRHGDWVFSGSAVVDRENTSKLGIPGITPVVAAWTSTGRGECIAYSLDSGRTFKEVPENPVVRHAGRDPKVFRHAPTNKWVMAVYDETPEGGKPTRRIAFYTSDNLRKWTFTSRIDGFFECPDCFPLPLPPGPDRGEKWVLHAADGKYRLGRFDGRTFTPETDSLQWVHGDDYAAQSYSDEPRGRRVRVGWLRNDRGVFAGLPFNQQMGVPMTLRLDNTPDGPRVAAAPLPPPGVGAITKERLYPDKDNLTAEPHQLPETEDVAGRWDAALLKVRASEGPRGRWETVIRGVPVVVDFAARTVRCQHVTAPLPPSPDGECELEIVADRLSLEVFVNGGRAVLTVATRFPAGAAGWSTRLLPDPAGPAAGVRLRRAKFQGSTGGDPPRRD